MTSTDESLFDTKLRVENKDIFIDLKKNKGGVYLKISERNSGGRNTVLIPASGIARLCSVLDEVVKSVAAPVAQPASREKKPRANATSPEVSTRTIYVSGLSWDTTDENLSAHFGQTGAVVKATILRQRRRRSGRDSMGCGLVEFVSVEHAVAAVNTFNDTEFMGRTIKCREDRTGVEAPSAAPTPVAPAAPKPKTKKVPVERPPIEDRVAEPTKIFVTGLPWDSTSEELKILFAASGRVAAAEVLTTKKGRSIGAAVIEFVDESSVPTALAQFTGQSLKGRKISVRQYYQ